MSGDQGAYVERGVWAPVAEARRLLFPYADGPGTYAGRNDWVPLTCQRCRQSATHCSHKRPNL